MRILRSVDDLDAVRGCALVPTMGALHEGHLALVRRAARFDAPVVVSVFVNPTQFGRGEDFDRYPRRLEADLDLAAEAGAELAFAPEVDTMYPPGSPTPVPPLPRVATEPGLEDAFRPQHFEGVCQVVARLFDLTRPRFAIFGEKDFQQLLVISEMVKSAPERWRDLEIVPHETVREPDGLAMSSRNDYLGDDDRERALGLSCALTAARAAQAAATVTGPFGAERSMLEVLLEHRVAIDYAVVRDAETLLPVETFDRPTRALVAARVGDVRLIDNQGLAEPS